MWPGCSLSMIERNPLITQDRHLAAQLTPFAAVNRLLHISWLPDAQNCPATNRSVVFEKVISTRLLHGTLSLLKLNQSVRTTNSGCGRPIFAKDTMVEEGTAAVRPADAHTFETVNIASCYPPSSS